MTRQIWDPFAALDLSSKRSDGGLYCIGRSVSRWNCRCPYKIPEAEVVQIHMMINSMTAFPPSEASIALSKLAKLCLCPTFHQDQKIEVVARWKKKLAEEDNQYEASKKLRTENLRLLGKLAEQRHERDRLENLVHTRHEHNSTDHDAAAETESEVGSEETGDQRRSARTGKLKMRLIAALHEAARHERSLQEAEVFNHILQSRVQQLETSYAEKVRDAEELQTFLEYQKAEFASQLVRERDTAQEYHEVLAQKKDAVQELHTSQDELIEALQLDIAGKTVALTKYEERLAEKVAKNNSLAKRVNKLAALLDSESKQTEMLQEDLERIGNSEYSLVARVSILEARLATELRKSEKLRREIVTIQEAEAEAVRQKEHYHSRFLSEKEALIQSKQQLAAELKRRSELLYEIEGLRRRSRHSISPSKDSIEIGDSVSEIEDDSIFRRRDSGNSEGTHDYRRSLASTTRQPSASAETTETMLLEEIILLRQQLLNECDEAARNKEEFQTRLTTLEAEKTALRGKLDTQEMITEKLDEILTINTNRAKESESRLRLHLDSAQAALRHAQMDLTNCNRWNEFLLTTQDKHLEQLLVLEARLASSPIQLVRTKLAALSKQLAGLFSSAWSTIVS